MNNTEMSRKELMKIAKDNHLTEDQATLYSKVREICECQESLKPEVLDVLNKHFNELFEDDVDEFNFEDDDLKKEADLDLNRWVASVKEELERHNNDPDYIATLPRPKLRSKSNGKKSNIQSIIR